MPYGVTSLLWSNEQESFFPTMVLNPLKQIGPYCVSTVLAMLTGAKPEAFQGKVNTQDPSSWSDSLRTWGKKLAYCPTDVRKIENYIPELVRLNDLFTLSYYSPSEPNSILDNPDEAGWICSSNIVIMHRDQIIDPTTGTVTDAKNHPCNQRHTKRIFRVVPSEHRRGL